MLHVHLDRMSQYEERFSSTLNCLHQTNLSTNNQQCTVDKMFNKMQIDSHHFFSSFSIKKHRTHIHPDT